ARGNLAAVDDETGLGVVVVRTRIEIVRTDQGRRVVDHDGFRVQADARAATGQRRFRVALVFAAVRAAGEPIVVADHAGGVGRERLELVDTEAELLQVTLLVLVRQRVHVERVGRGERIGRHDDFDRRFAFG